MHCIKGVHKVRINGHLRAFRMKIWHCCGGKWELLLARQYPEREKWTPICDECKNTC